jgi:hypothetical protein
MISSMTNLDILSRAHRNDDGQDRDLELSPLSWFRPSIQLDRLLLSMSCYLRNTMLRSIYAGDVKVS